jgi:hypothetical protein
MMSRNAGTRLKARLYPARSKGASCGGPPAVTKFMTEDTLAAGAVFTFLWAVTGCITAFKWIRTLNPSFVDYLTFDNRSRTAGQPKHTYNSNKQTHELFIYLKKVRLLPNRGCCSRCAVPAFFVNPVTAHVMYMYCTASAAFAQTPTNIPVFAQNHLLLIKPPCLASSVLQTAYAC